MAAQLLKDVKTPPKAISRLAILDETLDLLARNAGVLVPVYLVAALPFAVVGLFFLDAALAGKTARLPLYAALLVVTGWLRWLGGLAVQRRTVHILDGMPARAWRAGIRSYLWLRLFWFPMYAGPVAMDPAAHSPLRRIGGLKAANRGFFTGLLMLHLLFFCVVMLQVLVVHVFLTHLLLPYILGWDSQMLRVVLYSRFWWLAVTMLSLLGLEFFQLVSGVLAYRAVSSRWTGADLFKRMGLTRGGGA